MHQSINKQYFIEIDSTLKLQGHLYEIQLAGNDWNLKESQPLIERKEFSSQVEQNEIENSAKGKDFNIISQLENWNSSSLEKINIPNQKPEEIKQNLLKKANSYYDLSLRFYSNLQYEQAVMILNKALNLNSINLEYYFLKCDLLIEIADFKTAISNINKLINIKESLNPDEINIEYENLQSILSKKLAFYYYIQGQVYYDAKFYLEAFDSFTRASEINAEFLTYRIRSVSCLVALNRINEALAFVNKVIEENGENQQNVQLYVLRARLHLKYKNQTLCYYDLRDALLLQPNHKEASQLMKMIEDTAEQLRNTAIVLGLNGRLSDALNKISGAISMNPSKAEYNLQRGIIYKRMKNFNAAIDDFILGLDKIDHNPFNDSELFSNLQRQILLTYNEFAIQCFEKQFYDESILLLNKAIKLEKNEKSLYVNRGDCFYKKNDYDFALLDYFQGLEIDNNDKHIKNRIAKIYYEHGVKSYDTKNYENANEKFTNSIKYAPSLCKYYISRARTFYLLENKEAAQIDVCISVLLDPSNSEIPSIISRLFPDENLNDVLKSDFMKKAMEYLTDINIEPKINITNHVSNNLSSNRLERPIGSVDTKLERKSFEKIIELKKKNRDAFKIGSKSKLNYNESKIKLKHEQGPEDEGNNCEWRKFCFGTKTSKN